MQFDSEEDKHLSYSMMSLAEDCDSLDGAFMDNIILRMRMCQRNDKPHPSNNNNVYPAVGRHVSGDGINVSTSEAPADTNVSLLPGLHCDFCCFPKYCKRGPFLYHRFLCPCDVDVAVDGEPSWLTRTEDLMTQRRVRHCRENAAHGQRQSQGDTELEGGRDFNSDHVDVSGNEVDTTLGKLLTVLGKAVQKQVLNGHFVTSVRPEGAGEKCHVTGVGLNVSEQNENNSSSSNMDNDSNDGEDDMATVAFFQPRERTQGVINQLGSSSSTFEYHPGSHKTCFGTLGSYPPLVHPLFQPVLDAPAMRELSGKTLTSNRGRSDTRYVPYRVRSRHHRNTQARRDSQCSTISNTIRQDRLHTTAGSGYCSGHRHNRNNCRISGKTLISGDLRARYGYGPCGVGGIYTRRCCCQRREACSTRSRNERQRALRHHRKGAFYVVKRSPCPYAGAFEARACRFGEGRCTSRTPRDAGVNNQFSDDGCQAGKDLLCRPACGIAKRVEAGSPAPLLRLGHVTKEQMTKHEARNNSCCLGEPEARYNSFLGGLCQPYTIQRQTKASGLSRQQRQDTPYPSALMVTKDKHPSKVWTTEGMYPFPLGNTGGKYPPALNSAEEKYPLTLWSAEEEYPPVSMNTEETYRSPSGTNEDRCHSTGCIENRPVSGCSPGARSEDLNKPVEGFTFAFSLPDVVLSEKQHHKILPVLLSKPPEIAENYPAGLTNSSFIGLTPQRSPAETSLFDLRLKPSQPAHGYICTTGQDARTVNSKGFNNGMLNTRNTAWAFLPSGGVHATTTTTSYANNSNQSTCGVSSNKDQPSTINNNHAPNSSNNDHRTNNNSNNNDTPHKNKNCHSTTKIDHTASNNSNNNDQPHNNNSSNNNDQPANNNSSNQPPQARVQLRGRVVRVEGDGRCLFRSLVTAEWPPLQAGSRDDFGRPQSYELAQQETTRADLLRARVVSIMAENMHFYSQLGRTVINADQPVSSSYHQFRDRLSAMSDPATMPGDLELNALALVLERQILVLNTNLTLITSYGTDRFPQSQALAVRFTRLGPDVGHYDAVILGDSHLHNAINNVNNVSKMDCTTTHGSDNDSKRWGTSVDQGLCGDFRKLRTSEGGKGWTSSQSRSHAGTTGDATLNAKREFFYLRERDKTLHSEGQQPVQPSAPVAANSAGGAAETTSGAAAAAAPPAEEQKTAEATTSTTRATVHWPPTVVDKPSSRRCHSRYKTRTFTNKHTQTDGEDGGPRYQARGGDVVQRTRKLGGRRDPRSRRLVACARRAGARKKRPKSGVAAGKSGARRCHVGAPFGGRYKDSSSRDKNWNSRVGLEASRGRRCTVRDALTISASWGSQTRFGVVCSGKNYSVRKVVEDGVRFKALVTVDKLLKEKQSCYGPAKCRQYLKKKRLVSRMISEIHAPNSNNKSIRKLEKSFPCSKLCESSSEHHTPPKRTRRVNGCTGNVSANSNVASRRKSPTTYISICAPAGKPEVGNPGKPTSKWRKP